MANDIAVRRVRWRGPSGIWFECQQPALGIHLEIVHGLDETFSVRGADSIILGREGVRPRNRVPFLRSIELSGSVRGDLTQTTEATRMSDYRVQVDALQFEFDPTGLGTLQVFREDGQVAAIAARPVGGGLVYGVEKIPGERTVSVALTSTVDPYWTLGPAPDESSITWDDQGIAPAWVTLTAYLPGDVVLGDDSYVWVARDSGTSGAVEPDWAASGTSVVDASLTWDRMPVWAVQAEHVASDVVQPITPNTHWYLALDAGTSGVTEPTWPTDGSTVEDPL